jgi:molybdate transport system substrate-binding protein
VQSAPFDVFMAADTMRPRLLLEAGLARQMNVYATGQLMLIANQLSEDDCELVLSSEKLKYLAIANPDLAPYGRAAKQFLINSKLWVGLKNRIVMGESIMQAWQMVQTRNATAGLVAKSLLSQTKLAANQCTWSVPASSHEPIDQALVLLNRSKQQTLFTEFMLFMKSAAAIGIITDNGYLVLSPH